MSATIGATLDVLWPLAWFGWLCSGCYLLRWVDRTGWPTACTAWRRLRDFRHRQVRAEQYCPRGDHRETLEVVLGRLQYRCTDCGRTAPLGVVCLGGTNRTGVDRRNRPNHWHPPDA